MFDSQTLESKFMELEFQRYKELIYSLKPVVIPQYLINAVDTFHNNLLFYASLYDNSEVVQKLISSGAFVVESIGGLSPISWFSENAALEKLLSYRYGGEVRIVNDPTKEPYLLPNDKLSILLLPKLYLHILLCMVARGFKLHISNLHDIECSTEGILNSMDYYMRSYMFNNAQFGNSLYTTIESYSNEQIGLPNKPTVQQENAVQSISMLFGCCLTYLKTHHNTQYYYDMLSSVFLRFGYNPIAVYRLSNAEEKEGVKVEVISSCFTRATPQDVDDVTKEYEASKKALDDATKEYEESKKDFKFLLRMIKPRELTIQNKNKLIRIKRMQEEDQRLQGVARLVMEFARFDLQQESPIATISKHDLQKIMEVISMQKSSIQL